MISRDDSRLRKKIRKLRKEAGLNQEMLAEKLGLSSKYIQFIENGNRRPSLKVIYRIARILKVKVCQLFCPENMLKK